VLNLAPPAPFVYKIQGANDRVELIVSTSRILTLDQKIPQAQVNNPDILDLVPLSPTQVQISAKRPGVTQVNLWGEDKRIYTIDVVVFGDARELALVLRSKFPKTALDVSPVGSAVLISGFVGQQDLVPRIIQIAQEYYPKVINNMTVSGVQLVLLHVKVMEVSRTKLRNLGFDFSKITNGNLLMSGVSGLITTATGTPFGPPGGAPDNTLKFSVLTNGGSSTAFFGVLAAMREDNLSKILSEPNISAVSGRPSYILVGGEIGYVISNGLAGTPQVGWKQYGTRLDFVPIVLGNGRIHLDLRPSVSEPDQANSIDGIPAIKTREAETGVELLAGQTLAIGGLIEQRIEASNKGLPWISEVPYLGAAFRTVEETTNEVELLIMVTPELVDGMDAHQVPPCGPGLETTSPSDWELFFKGHLEVPVCCPGPAAGPETAATAAGAAPAAPAGQPTAAGGGPQASYLVAARPDSGRPQAAQNPNSLAGPAAPPAAPPASREIEPPFVGPIGYDVVK
jgi:pilus assembly protein CpaC